MASRECMSSIVRRIVVPERSTPTMKTYGAAASAFVDSVAAGTLDGIDITLVADRRLADRY